MTDLPDHDDLPAPDPDAATERTPSGTLADSRALASAAAGAADDKKATDVVVLEVAEIIGICDHFVICSAPNPRLVAAVAQEVEDQLAARFDRRPSSVEGLDDRRWVLVDYGELVVHVFAEDERAYYRLERLYGDAPRLEWRSAAVDPA